MNKDEMIEEMASIICKETSNEGLCEKCDFKKHEQFGYTYQCRKFDDAEALYNAGYRKVDDDEIVVKKEAYEKFVGQLIEQEEIAHSYEQGYAELLQSNHFLQDKLENARQETTREILQELKEMFGTSREFIWIGAGMGSIGDHISDRIEQFAKDKDIELED